MVYNCSSLAGDLQKIFESYWVMGRANSSLPHPWPPEYDTTINRHRPLLVAEHNVSSRIYLAVSFSSLLQEHLRLTVSFHLQLFNHMKLAAEFVSPQGAPPSFCPPSRTQDLEAILSSISEARRYVDVAVMEYFPTTRFERPQRSRREACVSAPVFALSPHFERFP